MNPEITIEQARRVLEVIDAGLCKGVGKPEPGRMCVEAAVCYGLGLPFGDDPQCVEPAVRSFKIKLNDARWSSNAARAKGLRAVGIAQLGSRGAIDSVAFCKKLAELTIRRIVPIRLRAAAKKSSEQHSPALISAAEKCEKEGTWEAALEAHASASASAAYAAATSASSAAYAAATSASAYAAYAATSASAYAAYAAYASTSASASAYAASASDAAASASDAILTESSRCAIGALRFVNAPGIKLMDALILEAQ